MNPMETKSLKIKNLFSKKEDDQIRLYVNKFGPNFSKIRDYLHNRTPKQVRERWRLYLDPDADQNPFSREEDLLLFEKYKEFKEKWCQIAKFFPHRRDTQLKHQYFKISGKNRKMPNDEIFNKIHKQVTF
jgi:hypothetical protein